MNHLVDLGGTGWSVWRDVLLRGAGFPADGLDRFAAPDCAGTADRHLAGEAGAGEFAAAYARATADAAGQVCLIAADPLFREAVTWQNPGVLVALDALVAAGPDGRRNQRRRDRESVVARYWQRYVAKNETIGFFGPVCWGRVDPGAAGVTARPGPGLVRQRRVHLEYWALAGYADRLTREPAVRRRLRPVLAPHLTLAGREVLRPARPPVPVSVAEAAALALCDGRRAAVDVVEALAGDGRTGVRRAEDAMLVLARLADRGLLRWDFDLPQGPDAEARLRAAMAAIEPAETGRGPREGLDRLTAARDRVAAAAGDPDRVREALADLDAEFTALVGSPPRRRDGQTYAGRTLCYEETVRDLTLVVGGDLLDALAAPLAPALQAARWLTVALAEAYGAALRELYADLAAGATPVRLADLWYLAQGPLFGAGDRTGDRPVDRVAADFARRWDEVFGLSRLPPGTRRLSVPAARFAERVAACFPATRPGWSAGRIHSPDLQICAASVDAVGRGDFLAVLGELHAAWPTFDLAIFTAAHPDAEALRAALAHDLGPYRLRPLYPLDWPRSGGRLVEALAGPTDRQLGFADAPGADRERLLPATAATVTDDGGRLVVRAPGGRCWPLIEAFSALVSMHAVDGFKRLADLPHTPRITVDRLVLGRETWRTTVHETGLPAATGDPAATYLAARRWRAALGLPERVFVKVATETKPCYVDLRSPLYVSWLARLLRGARLRAGPEVPVVVTEMLPTPDQAWLPDAHGRRYFSELRLQITDPRRPEGGCQ